MFKNGRKICFANPTHPHNPTPLDQKNRNPRFFLEHPQTSLPRSLLLLQKQIMPQPNLAGCCGQLSEAEMKNGIRRFCTFWQGHLKPAWRHSPTPIFINRRIKGFDQNRIGNQFPSQVKLPALVHFKCRGSALEKPRARPFHGQLRIL